MLSFDLAVTHLLTMQSALVFKPCMTNSLPAAALRETEAQHGLKYVADKLPKGSMLIQVGLSLLKQNLWRWMFDVDLPISGMAVTE